MIFKIVGVVIVVGLASYVSLYGIPEYRAQKEALHEERRQAYLNQPVPPYTAKALADQVEALGGTNVRGALKEAMADNRLVGREHDHLTELIRQERQKQDTAEATSALNQAAGIEKRQ